ncbi:MAG: hypothetical protein L0154_15660 [Chloroflexi bacterium]|nr:hypothetical protein [Chloroflexota bacterium]
MSRLIIVLVFVLLLIAQPASAMQDDDTELRFIEAEDPVVQQQGAWTLVEDTDNASGDGYLVSSGEPDDELGLLFEGTQIEVVYLTGPDYGTFHIEIDNEIVQTIDTASDESQFGVRAVVEDLESGYHIIRVIAENGAVAVDGFEVTATDPEILVSLLPERTIVDEAEILAGFETQTHITVVVGFEVPAMRPYHELTNEEVLVQEDNVAFVAETIAAELIELDADMLRRRQMVVPYITLTVDRTAYEHLLTLPYVTYIVRQTLLFTPQPAAAMQGDDTELRFVEAEDLIVQQQGAWSLVEDTDNASGDGYLVSSGEPNDELGLLFEGTQIEVVHLTGPDYGTFHIEIDNEIVQTVDAASDELQFGVRAVVEDLDSGFHIIRVIADSGAIAVDGFEVTPTDPEILVSLLPERTIVDEAEILAGFETQTHITVVVGFEVPTMRPYEELTIEEVSVQRKNVVFVADTIAAELIELDAHMIRRSQMVVPYISFVVDQAAYEHLLTLPYVTYIVRRTLLFSPQPTTTMQNDDTELRFIEAEDPIVQQQGEWTLIEDPDNASGEGYLVSSGEPDDELGLLFEGTQIEVIYLTSANYGTFHIEVDNEIVQTVDATFEEPQFWVRAVVNDLASGYHIIRVIAQDGVVAVDGFEIMPSSQPISLLERTEYHDRLLTLFDNTEKIMITLRYHVPPMFMLETRLENETERLQQRANNALVRDTLLQELSEYDIEIISNIENELSLILPSITLLVDKPAYRHLLEVPYITFIRRN